MDQGTLPQARRQAGPTFTWLERHPDALLNMVLAFCLLFGVALIAQVQVAGDGMWHWYAVLWRHGRHLYSELHFPLQPLFVLLTAAGQSLFGESWIASKVLALFLLVTYCLTLRAIARRAPMAAGPKAVLLLTGFAFPLLFEAFRFDDYHILADCFEVLTVLELLRLAEITFRRTQSARDAPSAGDARSAANARDVWGSPILLGVFSGLSIMTRPNDGGVLLITSLVVFAFVVQRDRWLALCRLLGTSVLTCALVLGLTRDSLPAWLDSSVRKAATAKGGSSHIVLYPFQLVLSALHEFRMDSNYLLFAMLTALVMFSVAFATSSERTSRLFQVVSPSARAVIMTLLCWMVLVKAQRWKLPLLPTVLCGALVLIGTACAGVVLLRAVRALRHPRPSNWDAKELLLLIPVGQLYSGSLSSGGYFQPLAAPIGVLLLVLPFSLPRLLQRSNRAYGYATVLALSSFACLTYKATNPFQWHTYRTAPLFTERQFYRTPVMGPIVIEKPLLSFIQPLCERVRQEPGTSLLSLPFPYPNTFCGVPPWHDNVQSFFDISTAEMNQRIVSDLRADPPRYIAYQRQTIFLRFHELVYNSGKRLSQRAIDELIGDRLRSRQWSIASETCIGDADWILIQTVPPSSLPDTAHFPVVWDRSRCTRSLSVTEDPWEERILD